MNSFYICRTLYSINCWLQGAKTIHRYMFLWSKDIPCFLRCHIITRIPVFGIFSLGRLTTEYPLPLSKLVTRKELTHWLSTQLINILVPGMVHYPGPSQICLANNPIMCFQLLLYLHSISYPSHWFLEFLQSVLQNDLKMEAIQAKKLPIPVSHAAARVNTRKVDLALWMPEFKMILASTRIGLPFHIQIPENFATTSIRGNWDL